MNNEPIVWTRCKTPIDFLPYASGEFIEVLNMNSDEEDYNYYANLRGRSDKDMIKSAVEIIMVPEDYLDWIVYREEPLEGDEWSGGFAENH